MSSFSKNPNIKTTEKCKLSTHRNKKKPSRPSTSNDNKFPSRFDCNYKREDSFMSKSDMSSCSENEEIVRKVRKGSFRALSDYESDNCSVTKAGSSCKSSSNYNTRSVIRSSVNDPANNNSSFICPETSHENSLSSEDDLFLRHSRRGAIRALSDYETGNSNDQNSETQLHLKRINQTFSNPASSSQRSDNINSYSESDSVCIMARNRSNKRRYNPLSTSDGSDSDVPTSFASCTKRKRIYTSSEESESEHSNFALINKRDKTKETIQTKTGRSHKSLHSRLTETRKLRSRNNQRKYIELETESESDSCNSTIKRHLIQSKIQFNEDNQLESTSNVGQFNIRHNTITNNSITNPFRRHKLKKRKNLRTQIWQSESESSSDEENNTYQPKSRNKKMSTSLQIYSITSDSDDVFNLNRTIQKKNPRTKLWHSENESSNDEESNIYQPKRRHQKMSKPLKRYNLASDSDSSNNSFFISNRRTLGGIIKIQDSDCSSDEVFTNVVDNSFMVEEFVTTDKTIDCSFNIKRGCSSDSDLDCEKCPICFSGFAFREVASPESCDHSFCTFCIQEWAKNNNTCPVDRKLFNKILVRSSFDGQVTREIAIETPSIETSFRLEDIIEVASNDEDPSFSYIDSDYFEEEEICCVCNQSNNPERLILCDYCNGIYHMRCLNPPLQYIPASNWYCPTCLTDPNIELFSD